MLPSTEVKAAFDSDSLPSSTATADALEIVLDVGPEASCGSSDEVSIGSDSVEMVSNDGGEALHTHARLSVHYSPSLRHDPDGGGGAP